MVLHDFRSPWLGLVFLFPVNRWLAPPANLRPSRRDVDAIIIPQTFFFVIETSPAGQDAEELSNTYQFGNGRSLVFQPRVIMLRGL